MILAYLFIISFLVAIDQYSKQIIATYINLGDLKEVIPDFFYLTNVHNTGAAWSIMEGEISAFIVITVGAILLFSYLLFFSKSKTKLETVSYLLVIGGAIGNFIDRINLNYVIDFLDFYIFKYDFPVFNLADCFLTIGVGLYIISFILENRHAKNKTNS